MSVHPLSQRVYMAVRRGRGAYITTAAAALRNMTDETMY